MSSAGAHLRVTGFVQGVGFRYFCFKRASALELVGSVKNLPDGSVAIAVEGDRGLIEEFIAMVKVGPGGADVRDVAIEWRQFTGRFKSFEVTG